MSDTDDPCPCGSGLDYPVCCGIHHRGATEAPSAEALMRARYSAYARRDIPYLIRSSHPLLRARLDARSLAAACALAWHRLEVVATSAGGATDTAGTVHFRAHWRAQGREGVLEEISRFVRDGEGAWVYRDGRRP